MNEANTERYKTPAEIRRDGPDRCRITGCHGNHEIDRMERAR